MAGVVGLRGALLAALVALVAAFFYSYHERDGAHREIAPSPMPPRSHSPPKARASLDAEQLETFAAANSQSLLRWGTYRSGLYYGIRSRSFPFSVSAGLLWTSQHEDVSQLRFECRQEDRLQKYGWLQHDGTSYGMQRIEDQHNRVALRTVYARLAGESGVDGWATRVTATHLEPRDERLRRQDVESTKLSLFFFVDLSCGDEGIKHPCREAVQNLLSVPVEPTEPQKCTAIGAEETATCTQLVVESQSPEGEIAGAGAAPFDFQVQFQLQTKASIVSSELRFSGLKDANVLNIKDQLAARAEQIFTDDGKPTIDREIILDNSVEEGSTLVVVQAIIEARTSSFEEGDVVLDVILNENAGSYSKHAKPALIDGIVSSAVVRHAEAFERKFEDTFHLSDKGIAGVAEDGSPLLDVFNSSVIEFAHAAFSNLIGGIGYFYGSSIVQHDPEKPEVVEMPPKPLFTAVPSRSFFPRGFLWDEGFHQLGISAFDDRLTRDIVAHWFGLMENDGYIAREQVLGQTARRRVPAEFLVQHVEHANPPTLLFAVEKILEHGQRSADEQQPLHEYVELIFPFLERWYEWFATTQHGSLGDDTVNSMRWRGRHPNDGKLIANTLSSGLDDYPRASRPSAKEMHVDLLAWMVKASDVMARLADLSGQTEKKDEYLAAKDRYLNGLDRYHWNEELQSYFDVGEHSEDGIIDRQVVIRCRNREGKAIDATAPVNQVKSQSAKCPPSHPQYMFPLGDGRGGLQLKQVFIPGTTQLQHVKHIGYVSIFPLLLKVLPPDSPRLRALLSQVIDPKHLWSPFGLRSMSTLDVFYERENAPGDNPYWRGSIWININYLALDALHHYAQPEVGSPFRAEFQDAYDRLRANVIANIYREYERTGYLWEQYSGDVNSPNYGRGQRCHPFSGWTALVVNIMAENY